MKMRYWEEEERRLCRKCGWMEETCVGGMLGLGGGERVAGDGGVGARG